MKKSPIQIPPSVVNSMNVLGLSTTETVCESIFSSPTSSVYATIISNGSLYSVFTSSEGVIILDVNATGVFFSIFEKV